MVHECRGSRAESAAPLGGAVKPNRPVRRRFLPWIRTRAVYTVYDRQLYVPDPPSLNRERSRALKPSSTWWMPPLLAAVGLVGGCLRAPEEPSPALRGQRLASELGCFACHGPEGRGGVADPLAPGGEVPDWSYDTARLFLSSEEDLRSWILHGRAPLDERRDKAGRHTSIAPMPGYQTLLSDRDLDDLVAYFLAVSGWRPTYSEDVYQGRQLAARLGCFGCHGPSGIGGVPNPGSATGHVPAWTGSEYADLVCDRDELRDWILEGRIERLRERRSKHKTRMPAYHDHLSDAELAKLIAYLESLQPTSAPAVTSDNDAAEVIGALEPPRPLSRLR